LAYTYEYYQSIELELQSILADLSGIIPDSAAANVRHYIDVGEYGVAHDTLCFAVVEGGYTIPPPVLQRIVDLAQVMEIDSKYLRNIKMV
jgi:hypothetical protein